MALASNIVFTHRTGAPAQNWFKGAFDFVSGTATFPSGVMTCTINNIPNLNTNSLVYINEFSANENFCEIYASRQTGQMGTITIGTTNGANTAGARNFGFYIRNI